jgi:hypothetical protein
MTRYLPVKGGEQEISLLSAIATECRSPHFMLFYPSFSKLFPILISKSAKPLCLGLSFMFVMTTRATGITI